MFNLDGCVNKREKICKNCDSCQQETLCFTCGLLDSALPLPTVLPEKIQMSNKNVNGGKSAVEYLKKNFGGKNKFHKLKNLKTFGGECNIL